MKNEQIKKEIEIRTNKIKNIYRKMNTISDKITELNQQYETLNKEAWKLREERTALTGTLKILER